MFSSFNSTAFGQLLPQHTKNLSHGTSWQKYVLFSMTHNTMLYNCIFIWPLVLVLKLDNHQAITHEHKNIQKLWHNIRKDIPYFVLLAGQYSEVINCFRPKQTFRAVAQNLSRDFLLCVCSQLCCTSCNIHWS